MHLALVTHNLIRGDGQGRVNAEIAHALVDTGHAVTLVAARVDDALAARDAVTWQRIEPGRGPTQLVKNHVFARRSARWLEAHRSAFDLVVANGFVTFAPADVNVAHFVHGAWLRSPVHVSKLRGGVFGAYHKLYTSVNARLERRAFAAAKRVVAVAERVRDELVDIGVPPEKITVVNNGVDIEEFRPAGPRSASMAPEDRRALGLPGTKPVALFVGDIRTPRKNLDGALRALARLVDTGASELRLAVAGRVAGSPYPQLAKDLGISNHVLFLDFRRDLPALMRAADFVVFPSRYDPFGLVVTEAMASAKPIVTASTAGAAALVAPEAGMVLADPDDVVGLADAMFRLTTDAGLRERMGQAGRSIAEQHTWAHMAHAYVAVFEAVAAGRAPGVPMQVVREAAANPTAPVASGS
ncbi:MAG: glycosyltransferase family 4 protein [Bacteroidota bacterium]